MQTTNRIPIFRRIGSILGVLGLAAYGAFGIWIDDLAIPGKRHVLHLSGLPAWMMVLAFLCAAAYLASVVVDHYDRRDNEAHYQLFQVWLGRLGWAFAGLALGLYVAGVHFPKPSQLSVVGWVLGALVFLFVAALGWLKPRQPINATHQANFRRPGPAFKASATRILAAVLLIPGSLLVLRGIIGLISLGMMAEPILATWGIGMSSVGAWLWVKANSPDLSPTCSELGRRSTRWLPLQIGAVIIGCIWASRWLDLSPRDGMSPAVQTTLQRGAAERVAAPEFTLSPTEFRMQTFSNLGQMLRTAGYNLRCYGDLRPKEKLYPSITQVCWTYARSAWGIPLDNISFHFGGDVLQFVRVEFPHDQWRQVKKWFFALDGQDAGMFGHDGQGNMVLGRKVGNGLLTTAAPARGSTVLVLWESQSLLSGRCRDNSFTRIQQAMLCPQMK